MHVRRLVYGWVRRQHRIPLQTVPSATTDAHGMSLNSIRLSVVLVFAGACGGCGMREAVCGRPK